MLDLLRELDVPDLAMLGSALIGVGLALIVITWPLEGERGEAWRIIRERFRR